MRGGLRSLVLVAMVLAIAGLFLLVQFSPSYFNATYLAGIVFAQVIIASIWHYEDVFFLLLLLCFLAAGMNTFLLQAGVAARWVFLAVGAFAGFIKWMSGQHQPFGAFHLIALFTVLAALVSAMVSAFPETALLKVLSLFLLFLYGASGARLAILGREAKFIHGLLIGCEVTVYASLVCYFGLHQEIFGNRNSLGAVMGVVVAPVLLWGALVAETRRLRQRRAAALFLSGFLLYFSLSRAGMAAAAVSTLLLCVSLRRQRLLVQGVFLMIFLVAVAGVVQPQHFNQFTSEITSTVIYKGKPEQGFWGSRKSPWQQTVAVIQEHPWFGSGFGTSAIGVDKSRLQLSSVQTREEAGREHGSSYLAITEWVGLLGVVPIAILLSLLLHKAASAYRWAHRTASPNQYSIPLAMIVVSGLVHAAFEDWLFAVGYYLTVFFWAVAFLLVDLAPISQEPTLVLTGCDGGDAVRLSSATLPVQR